MSGSNLLAFLLFVVGMRSSILIIKPLSSCLCSVVGVITTCQGTFGRCALGLGAFGRGAFICVVIPWLFEHIMNT